MAPPNRVIVGGKWVYTIKSGPNNEETYEARYVAKGYSQTAYLNAPIDCDIFVEQPKGYEKVGNDGKKLVLINTQ